MAADTESQRLRIAINAQILPASGAGGVESVLIGLISALGRLSDGDEEYVIVGPWQEPHWLRPYLGANQRTVSAPQPFQIEERPSGGERIKRVLGPVRTPARRIWRRLFPVPPPPGPGWPEVPISDGFFESLGCDVVHFPWQSFTLCSIPTIYNPHDLQHLHYPQFFNAQEIAWRDTTFAAGCHFAQVVVGSEWVKQDIVRHYHPDPEKVQVIPWAPPTQAYGNPGDELLTAVQNKYDLGRPFAFYPAMTWEHKNHLRLLEALAALRDRGVVIPLVCTGNRASAFWPRIQAQLDHLKLNDQVKFLGLVLPEELRAVYRLAQFVIVPTLFEAASGPVFEAWQEGVAVACSTVTSLPQQVGRAALLFDPYSAETIADALQRMATDEELRVQLIREGRRRLEDFSWERTAKAYRAVYRRAARRTLTDEDKQLLAWDWMQSPRSAARKAS